MTQKIRLHQKVSLLAMGFVTLTAAACSSSNDDRSQDMADGMTQDIYIAVPGATDAQCEITDQGGNSYVLEQAPGSLAVQKGGGALDVRCTKPGFRVGTAVIEEGQSGENGFFNFDKDQGHGQPAYPEEVNVAMIRDDGSALVGQNNAAAGFEPQSADLAAPPAMAGPRDAFGMVGDGQMAPPSAVPGMAPAGAYDPYAEQPQTSVSGTASRHEPQMPQAGMAARPAQGEDLMGDGAVAYRQPQPVGASSQTSPQNSLGTLVLQNGQVTAYKNDQLPSQREAHLQAPAQGQKPANDGAQPYHAQQEGYNGRYAEALREEGLTAPQSAVPAAVMAAAPAASQQGAFSVQVGAYRNADNAEKMMAKMRSHGLEPFLNRRGSLNQVRVGGFPTKLAAKEAAMTIHRYGIDAVAVRN